MNVPAHLKRYLQTAQQLLARGKLPGMLAAVLRKSAGKGGRLEAVKGFVLAVPGNLRKRNKGGLKNKKKLKCA